MLCSGACKCTPASNIVRSHSSNGCPFPLMWVVVDKVCMLLHEQCTPSMYRPCQVLVHGQQLRGSPVQGGLQGVDVDSQQPSSMLNDGSVCCNARPPVLRMLGVMGGLLRQPHVALSRMGTAAGVRMLTTLFDNVGR